MLKVFDFKCSGCDHIFEALVQGADGVPANCPECGCIDVTKQLSTAAFQCKGGYNSAFQFKTKK